MDIGQLFDLYWPSIFEAVTNTLLIITVAISLSSALGVMVGLGLSYMPTWLRFPLRAYIDIVRGLPALVLIFGSYYLLGYVFELGGISLSTFGAAIIALTVGGTADMAEITRGAVGTVSTGQVEAGRASGVSSKDIFVGILARQSLVQAAPPWSNSATEIVKGSTLLSMVGLNELVKETGTIVATQGHALFYYIVAALVYIVINLLVQSFALIIERLVDYPRS